MNTGSIDNVIFDIGNVLMRWEPERLYRRMFPNDAAIHAFYAETGLLTRNIEMDRGEPFAVALADLAARHPRHAEALRAFDHRWPETVVGEIPETVAMLHELRAARVPNYAITNFSREKFNIALEMFPVLKGFDDIVVSADVRMVKPDPAIFRVLLDRRKLNPARSLFIDDNADNIAAANSLGLITHHFSEPGALRRDLVSRGFLA